MLVLNDNTALSVGETGYDETKVRKSCSNYNEFKFYQSEHQNASDT